MVPYLEGEYTLQQAQRDLKAKARPCFLHFEKYVAWLASLQLAGVKNGR